MEQPPKRLHRCAAIRIGQDPWIEARGRESLRRTDSQLGEQIRDRAQWADAHLAWAARRQCMPRPRWRTVVLLHMAAPSPLELLASPVASVLTA
jgi:hypothetical protein